MTEVKKDIAFVRKEKKDDSEIAKKLEEIYGRVTSTRDNGYRRNKKGWECPSCGYVNFESRLACGECLDAHPDVVEGTKFARRSGHGKATKGNASATSSNYTTTTGGSMTEEVLKRVPNVREPGVSFEKFTEILNINNRCYRTLNFPNTAVALGKKKAIAKHNAAAAAVNKPAYTTIRNGNDDDGDEQPCDDEEDDGFGTCSDGSYDDDAGEDGPRGGCGGPGFVPSHAAGETLDDFGEEEDDDEANDGAPSSSNDGGVRIRKDSSGQYEARMYISPLLYGFIIGKQGSTLAETQRMTNTLIKVPKLSNKISAADDTEAGKKRSLASATPSEAETIVIRGPDRASVTAAVVKLEAIVIDNRARVGYTHFLSIPLGKSAEVRGKAENIITDIKARCVNEEKRIDATLFQTPSWMHFTVLVLRLHSHRDLALAKKLLQSDVRRAAERYIGGNTNSRQVRLQGLNIMNDDPTAVNVLFVEPKKEGEGVQNLLKFIAEINEIFISNGLCLRHDTSGNDKLHATLMNTKFRQSAMATAAGQSGNSGGKPAALPARIPFDASEVLAGFKDAFFCDYTLSTLELSRMNEEASSSTNRARMTYYGCEDAIEF